MHSSAHKVELTGRSTSEASYRWVSVALLSNPHQGVSRLVGKSYGSMGSNSEAKEGDSSQQVRPRLLELEY